MKYYSIAYIDFGEGSDVFPNVHEEVFTTLELARSFIEWDVNNLNEVYRDEPKRILSWNGNDCVVRSEDSGIVISKYRICEIDTDITTITPF